MLIQIVRSLVSNAEMVLVGSDPTDAAEYAAQLTWLDSRSQPTWAEIEQARPAVQHAQALAKVKADRHSAYVAESDPLFFGWQRGENTEVVWLAKVQEIRSRYPEPADA